MIRVFAPIDRTATKRACEARVRCADQNARPGRRTEPRLGITFDDENPTLVDENPTVGKSL